MNVIVTGASRGIGYEIVKEFCNREVSNVIIIARNGTKLEQIKKECKIKFPKIHIYQLAIDLSKKNIENKLSSIIKKNLNSKVDFIVNNAGMLINKPFEKLTDKNWIDVFEVNLFGTVRLIRAVISFLGKQNRSHIVNISSMGGFQGTEKFTGLSAYSTSKGALSTLTECLAKEFETKNIAVNCLALGAVQTKMLKQAFPKFKAPVSPSQMAKFIVDFTLSSHHVMNGKVIPVALRN